MLIHSCTPLTSIGSQNTFGLIYPMYPTLHKFAEKNSVFDKFVKNSVFDKFV